MCNNQWVFYDVKCFHAVFTLVSAIFFLCIYAVLVVFLNEVCAAFTTFFMKGVT